MTPAVGSPGKAEAAAYYFTYIDQVAAGDIRETLAQQLPEAMTALQRVTEERSSFRYAADKWSIKEVMSHINDGERVFVFRALWFARGFDTPLPSYDQEVAIAAARADDRSWNDHVAEFHTVRKSTIAFFQNLPDDAWMKRGIASDNPFTVRALAYIIAGHLTHHLKVLRDRYGA